MAKYIDRYTRCPECGGLRPKDAGDPAFGAEHDEEQEVTAVTYDEADYSLDIEGENTADDYISEASPRIEGDCGTTFTCPSGYVRYTVVQGDTFAGVARRYGLSTMQLWRANPCVDPQNITPGLVLCVPGSSTSPSPSPGGSCPTNYRRHTIVAGETFADVMIRYDVSYNALRGANRSADMNSLQAGMVLCIPPSGTRGVCDTNRSHIIEPGETTMMIATRFNTTIDELFRINPSLTPNDFTAGRVICIPAQRG